MMNVLKNSILPATKLPQIGNTQVTLESDVLIAVFLVGAAVLYFRGIPQALYRAVMSDGGGSVTGDNGVVSPSPTSVGSWGTVDPSPVFTPPSVSPTVGVGNPSPAYASWQGVIVPGSFNPVNQQAGGSVDPQPGGIIGAAPFIPPFFKSCWSLPDGTTIGQCNG